MGLPERLRDISGFLSESEEATKTCAEAADEIERLRAALSHIIADVESDDGLTSWEAAKIARDALGSVVESTST